MGFELIVEDTLYKEVIVITGDDWVDGVYFSGTEVKTYPTFKGIVEGYQKGITTIVAPEGVSDSEMLVLYTSSDLKTHQSLPQGSNMADIVYLTDPTVDSTATAYKVWNKAVFSKNQGFALIDGDCPEYLLVRETRT